MSEPQLDPWAVASSNEVTSAPAVPVEDEALQALRERFRKHEKPMHLGLRTLLFVVSLGAFVWFMRDSGPLVVAVIAGVLLFHEMGHFVAMKALGYENMNVFFVPFLGAAVSGRARKPGGWRAAVVSLAGPVPGLLLAAALLPWSTLPLVRAIVFALVFINALNLLPFVPLDGGRLMNTVLFSRHRYLEMIGTVVGVIGLFAVPDLLPGTPAIWAGVFVSMLFHRGKMIEATDKLRRTSHSFEGPTSALPGESIWALQGASHEVLQKSLATERTHTSTMASLHEAAATKPARWAHSIALIAVWAGALGLGWTSWQELKHPKAHWEEATGPQNAWSVKYPAPATLTTQANPFPGIAAVHQYVTVSPLGEFAVVSVVLEDQLRFEDNPEDAEGRLRAMVAETEQKAGFKVLSQTALRWEERPALDVTFQAKGQTIESRYVASGNAVHVVTTTRASPEDRTTFRESFRLLR